MFQRIIDSIGVLMFGKQYMQGIAHDTNLNNQKVYHLESIFPNEETKILAHKAIDKRNSKGALL